MTIQTDIQALYIAYFNRPADFLGLQYWTQQAQANGGSVAAVANAFSASPEYKALYEGKSSTTIINTIYQNLFGRAAEPDAISYWGTRLENGTFNIGNIANSILVGAQNADRTAIENKKVAAQAFYDALDTTAEIEAYEANSAVARDWLKGITTNESLAAATSASALATLLQNVVTSADGLINVGTNFTLTTDVDALTGTAQNDTFRAGVVTAGGTSTFTLGGLDAIDGGAGTDTLAITDQVGGNITGLDTVSVKNIETLTIRTAGDIGADNDLDISGWAGLTRAAIELNSATATNLTAAKTTAINVANKLAGDVNLVGGGAAVVVNTKGAVTLGQDTAPTAADANAYTSVIVTNAAATSITDNSGAAGIVGKTLTTVTLDALTAAAEINGNGVTTLNLANLEGQNVTLVNTTAKHSLAVNVDGVTDNKGTFGVVTDANATAVTLTAAGDSALDLAIAKAATLTVTGEGDVELGTAADDYSALTTVTYTGAGKFTADLTGATVLTSVTSAAATGTLDVTIVGTTGANAAQSVTGGAGDDKVTITGTLGKGSTLALGGGSDVVAVSGAGVIAAAAVVDAGAGVDTLGLSVVDATNVGVFKNFELFDVATISGSFDQEILDANNTVTGFVGSAAAGGALTLQNLGANVGFTVIGDMDATVVTLQQKAAGAITITSDVDAEAGDGVTVADTEAAFATNATSVTLAFDNDNTDAIDNLAKLTVTAADATTVTVQSGGAEVTNSAVIAAAKATTITVTGDQHLVLTDVTGAKLTTIDASAATGGVTVDLADVLGGADAGKAVSAGTIKLGSGDDIVNLTANVPALAANLLTTSTIRSVQGVEKAATAEETEQSNFDVFHFTGVSVAGDEDAASATAFSIKDGIYKLASGVQTLTDALTQIDGNIGTDEAVVFSYANVNYLYVAGSDDVAHTDDVIVKLTGVTGVTALGEVGTDNLYLVG